MAVALLKGGSVDESVDCLPSVEGLVDLLVDGVTDHHLQSHYVEHVVINH